MRRRTARYDDDSDSLDGVGRDYDRMGLAEFAANDPYDSREPYDGGGRPNVSPERSSRRYDSIGRYVLSRNRLPRRRRIWRDNRPTRGPRWMREPVDLQTAATCGTVTPGSSRGARRRGRVSSWRSSRGRSGADPRPSVYAGRDRSSRPTCAVWCPTAGAGNCAERSATLGPLTVRPAGPLGWLGSIVSARPGAAPGTAARSPPSPVSGAIRGGS